MTRVLKLAFYAAFMGLHVVSSAADFVAAKPVWLRGRESEMNVFAGFRAEFDRPEAQRVVLRVTASSLYRAHVNGTFIGHGPARAAHDYYRVDEWDVTPALRSGRNIVAIEVAGYNANSYYLLNQLSFVQAEILADDKPVAFTSPDAGGFAGRALPERVQKVQRTSFQRPFAEAYLLAADSDKWKTDPGAHFPAESLAATELKKLLPRGISYPRFRCISPASVIQEGTTSYTKVARGPYQDRSLTQIGPKLAGFPQDQLQLEISRDIVEHPTASITARERSYNSTEQIDLGEHRFVMMDFGHTLTGFVKATAQCATSATILFSFDEMLRGDNLEALRLGMVGAVRYDLAPGTHHIEFFEPHTLRYLKVLTMNGSCAVREIGLREYANDDAWEASFACSDERLQRIFEAGRQTFRQNSSDIFMDCPSRERAGWLCDSFFTARAAADLTGKTDIERNFLENFALPTTFKHLPDGMLPMCYPADHDDGVYIPNWAMWFVVQLEEYYKRSGDRELVDRLQPRVLKLVEFLAKYRNSDGLLEKLESWVFVEWSKANEFTQDVNYPSNMLYAGTLDAAGRLYNRTDLTSAAATVRERVRAQSFNGHFFCDNAMRRATGLERQSNMSEVCQYFAFYFDIATPQSHAELWKILRDEFGAARAQTKAYPEVHPANAFVGNIMRQDLLGRFGATRELPDNLCFYYLDMANRTGTIWENATDVASLNHGFGSHVVHTLYRDVLGISLLDTVNKRVELRVPVNSLQWCNGRVATPEGHVEYSWRREGEKVVVSYSVPSGYTVLQH